MAKKGNENMSVQKSRRETFNLSKRIPLHYQKRYLANISNGSFNATLMTGIYKNKIKALLKNNRLLAQALHNDRAKKEELLEENISNANIVMFSRLKLASLSDNLKKVVTVLDETLALLQMHSSASVSKLTPKNIMGREEFKKQVQGVLMGSIPEEPESPQKTQNSYNKVTPRNKKQKEKISPKFLTRVSEKSQQPCSKLNEELFVNDTNKVYEDTIIKDNCQSISPVNNYEECNLPKISTTKSKRFSTTANNYEECSPAKLTERKSKRLSTKNKNVVSEFSCGKVSTISTAIKKSSKVPNKNVLKNAKRARSLNEDIENKNNSGPLKDNSPSDIQMLGVQKPKNNCIIPENTNAVCTFKNKDSSRKSCGNIINNTYLISDCEKENENCGQKQKMLAKRFKSSSKFELKTPASKNTFASSSARKSLSSIINIENSEGSGRESKKYQIDDLVTTAALSFSEKCDTSRSYLQDLSLHQREMVKNLAKNTFLVTAEVHRSPEPPRTDKIKFQKTGQFVSQEPIVLVKDIFQSGKSFCKSISSQTFNGTPLELQLLEHCSSLKVIPEESMHSQENSIDETETKVLKTKKNIDPPLSFEDEVIDQQAYENKRIFRKRAASVCYKEPTLNEKLRR